VVALRAAAAHVAAAHVAAAVMVVVAGTAVVVMVAVATAAVINKYVRYLVGFERNECFAKECLSLLFEAAWSCNCKH